MRKLFVLGLAVAVSAGFAVSSAMAVDIPITPLKQIVVNKTTGAKAIFVAKDPAVTKGSGTDATMISSQLDISGTTAPGSFVNPQGASWLVNKSTVGKYVNKPAPSGGATKVSVIKPAKLIKNVGKSLGDSPLSIAAAPAGEVHAVYTVVNGGSSFRHCGKFTSCSWKLIAGDTGQKMVCKGTGAPDTCPSSPSGAFID
jgi:hypothetical protein